MYSLGFNFEVPPESFIAEEDLLPDDPDDDEECEPMIVSVELSNRDTLKVCPRASASTKMGVGVQGRSMGDRSLNPMVAPMIVENDMHSQRQGQAMNAHNNNKNSRYIGSSNQINSSSTTCVTTTNTTTTHQSNNAESAATGAKLLEILAKGLVGNGKPGTKKMGIHQVPQDGAASRTEVPVINSKSDKKEAAKKEQLVLPSVTAVGADPYGGKKAKRASAAAAVSKIKASIEDTSDGSSRPAVPPTAQVQPSPGDKKNTTPELTLKNTGNAADAVRPARDAEKRKSRVVQKSSGMEVKKETAVVKVEEPPITAVPGKRESRRRTSEKMDVDPLPTVAAAATTTTKPKESAPSGRKGKQVKDTATAASTPKSTPPEQSVLFSEYKSCPPQRAAAVAALRNAALAQRGSSQRNSSSSQKTSSPTQKTASSPTQKPAAQKSASPKGASPSQKSPVSAQKGSASSQKTSSGQKSSVTDQKQVAQKSSSPPVKSAPVQKGSGSTPVKKSVPVHRSSATGKKPAQGQKGVSQKPEGAPKTSVSPTPSPAPERRSLTLQKKSSLPEKTTAPYKESSQKSTSVAANSSSTQSQSNTAAGSKRKRNYPPSQTASKNTPHQQAASPQDKAPAQKTLEPVESFPVPDSAKKKKPSPSTESRAAARKASLTQRQEPIQPVRPTVTLKPVEVQLTPVFTATNSDGSQKLNDAVRNLSLVTSSGQKNDVSSDEKKIVKAVKEADDAKETALEGKKVEKAETKKSLSKLVPSSVKGRKATASNKTAVSKESKSDVEEVDVGENETFTSSVNNKDRKQSKSLVKTNIEVMAEVSGTPPIAIEAEGTSHADVVSNTDTASHDDAKGKEEQGVRDVDMEDVSETQGRDTHTSDVNKRGSSQEEHLKLSIETSSPSSTEKKSAVMSDQVQSELLEKLDQKMTPEDSSKGSVETRDSNAKADEVVEDMVTSSSHVAKEVITQSLEEKMEVDSLPQSSVEAAQVVPEEATGVHSVPASSEAGHDSSGAQLVVADTVVSSSRPMVQREQDSDGTSQEKEEPMAVEEEGENNDGADLPVVGVKTVGELGKGLIMRELTEGCEVEKEKIDHVKVEGDVSSQTEVEGDNLEAQGPANVESGVKLKEEVSSGDITTNQTHSKEDSSVAAIQVGGGQGVAAAEDPKLKPIAQQKQEESESETSSSVLVNISVERMVIEGGRGEESSKEESNDRGSEIEKGENNVLEGTEALPARSDVGTVQEGGEQKEVEKIEVVHHGEKGDRDQEKEEVYGLEEKDPANRDQTLEATISEVGGRQESAPVQTKDEVMTVVQEINRVGHQSLSKEEESCESAAAENVTSFEQETKEEIIPQDRSESVGRVDEATTEEMLEEGGGGTDNVDDKDVEVNKESEDKKERKELEVKEEGQAIPGKENPIVEEKLPVIQDPAADTDGCEGVASSVQLPDIDVMLTSDITSRKDDGRRDGPLTEPMDQDESAQPGIAERPISITGLSSNNCHVKLTSSPRFISEPSSVGPEQAASPHVHKFAMERMSSGFLSPRHSPAPSSSQHDEDRGFVSSALLYSPAPSLDDTSSLRVEPPSPRSEISNMEVPSFMEVTPVDGQASAMELSAFDVEDPSGLEPVLEQESGYESKPVPEQIQERESMVVSSLTEEKLGSEVSSELSSLPPLGNDDVSEEGVSMEDLPEPQHGPDASKIDPLPDILESPVSSVVKVTLPVGAMEVEGAGSEQGSGQSTEKEIERASLQEQSDQERMVSPSTKEAVVSAAEVADNGKDSELPKSEDITGAGEVAQESYSALPRTTDNSDDVDGISSVERTATVTPNQGDCPSSLAVATDHLQDMQERPQEMDLSTEEGELKKSEDCNIENASDRTTVEDAGLVVASGNVGTCSIQETSAQPAMEEKEQESEARLSEEGESILWKDETVVLLTDESPGEPSIAEQQQVSVEAPAEVLDAVGGPETDLLKSSEVKEEVAMLGGLQSLQAAYDDDDDEEEESNNGLNMEHVSDSAGKQDPAEEMTESTDGQKDNVNLDEEMSDGSLAVGHGNETYAALENNAPSDEQELHEEVTVRETMEKEASGNAAQDSFGDTVKEEAAVGPNVQSADDLLGQGGAESRGGDHSMDSEGVADMDVEGPSQSSESDASAIMPDGGGLLVSCTSLTSREREEDSSKAPDHHPSQPVVSEMVSHVLDLPEGTIDEATVPEEKSQDEVCDGDDEGRSVIKVPESEAQDTRSEGNATQDSQTGQGLGESWGSNLDQWESQDGVLSPDSLDAQPAVQGPALEDNPVKVGTVASPDGIVDTERSQSVERSGGVSSSRVENEKTTDTQKEGVMEMSCGDRDLITCSVEEGPENPADLVSESLRAHDLDFHVVGTHARPEQNSGGVQAIESRETEDHSLDPDCHEAAMEDTGSIDTVEQCTTEVLIPDESNRDNQDANIPDQQDSLDQNILNQEHNVSDQNQDIPKQSALDQDISDQDQNIQDQDQNLPNQDQDILNQDQDSAMGHNIPHYGDISDQDIPDQVMVDQSSLGQHSPHENAQRQGNMDDNSPEQISLEQEKVDENTLESCTATHLESSNLDITEHKNQNQDWHIQDMHARESSDHSTQNQNTPFQYTQETHKHDTLSSDEHDVGMHKLSNQDQEIQNLDNQNQDNQKLQVLDNQDLDIQNLNNQDQDIQNLDNLNKHMEERENQGLDIEKFGNQNQGIQSFNIQDREPQNSDSTTQNVDSASPSIPDSECGGDAHAAVGVTSQDGDTQEQAENDSNMVVETASGDSIPATAATAMLVEENTESTEGKSENLNESETGSPVNAGQEQRDKDDRSPSGVDLCLGDMEGRQTSGEEVIESKGDVRVLCEDDDPEVGVTSVGNILAVPDPSVSVLTSSVENSEERAMEAASESEDQGLSEGGMSCEKAVSKISVEVALSEGDRGYGGEGGQNIGTAEDTSENAVSVKDNNSSGARSDNEEDLKPSGRGKDEDGSEVQLESKIVEGVADQAVSSGLDQKDEEHSGCYQEGSEVSGRSQEIQPLSECSLKEQEPLEQEPSGCGQEEQESSGCGLEEQESSGCGLEEQEPSGCDLEEQGPSGCGQKEQESSGCGQEEQEPSGCGQEEQKLSGRGQEEQEPSGCGQQEQESSGCGQEEQEMSGCGQEESNTCGQKEEELNGSGEEEQESVCCLEEEQESSGCGPGDSYSVVQSEGTDTADEPRLNDKAEISGQELVADVTGDNDNELHQQTRDNEEQVSQGVTASGAMSTVSKDKVSSANALSELISGSDGGKDDTLAAASAQLLNRPSASEGQVSVGSHSLEEGGDGQCEDRLTTDPGQVEMDLMLHAEADDLSVFSSEVAEADNLVAAGSKGRLAVAGVKRRSSSSSHCVSTATGESVTKKRRTSRGCPGDGSSCDANKPSLSSPKDSKRPRETVSVCVCVCVYLCVCVCVWGGGGGGGG